MISFWKKPFTVAVHDGTFHTDDVFACAVVLLAHKNKKVTVIRTRDEKKIASADCVIDVGVIYDPKTLRFDHHQKEGAGERENGVPYASFGLVWKHYGTTLCSSEHIAHIVDERLVAHIDAVDNGVALARDTSSLSLYTVGDFISSLRPTWEEDEACIDTAFFAAVDFAKKVLLRAIAQVQSSQAARALLEEAYTQAKDKRIIVIGKEYPGWYDVMVQYPEPLYVVYERSNGSFGAKAVRVDPADFETRKPFPKEWAGLRDKEFQNVSGVPDALFCHTGRFLIVAETKEGVLALAQKAILL